MAPTWFWNVPWDAVRAAANDFNLDPLLVGAVVIVESYGNVCAQRYEPGFYDRYLRHDRIAHEHRMHALDMSSLLSSTYQTEIHGRATSWGAMQVMGQVAREKGFTGWFPELCDARTGMEYGAMHLREKLDEYGGVLPDAVAAYNAGSVRRSNGEYENQGYVDKIFHRYAQLKKLWE